MNKHGQAMIYAVVTLPVLILLSGYIYKASAAVLYHNQVQTSIDQKALKILSIQAQGLEALGKINFIAKSTIDARRLVDQTLIAAATAPAAIPHLIKLREKLVSVQKIILARQNFIKSSTLIAANSEARFLFSREFKLKVTAEKFPNLLTLYTKDISEYRGETGAPLELSKDFNKKQNILINAQIKTERFLYSIKESHKFKNIKLTTFAKIEMHRLEDPWEVRLRTPLIMPSAKAL